jgi:hypothetical protein
MNVETFDIENQWKLYLQRIGLKEEKMPKVQAEEMKRVFFGATGQMLMIICHDLTNLSDQEGASVIESMVKQVERYWLKEGTKQN